MAEYLSVSANKEHIDRHFADSLVPGSKFFPVGEEDKQAIIDAVDFRLAETFQNFIDGGQEPSRVVFQMTFPKAIGTDALVEISSDQKNQFVEVTRDGGTPNESKVQIREADKIPETNVLTVVAGSYGPTGKWGIYTMFPGVEAPAFPNPERQKPEALEASQNFWNTHGFLATTAEMQANLPQLRNTAPTEHPKPANVCTL